MLISTTDFKLYNSIIDNNNDTLIANCVSSSQAYVETYCNRTLESSSFTEYKNGNGDNILFLNYKPINSITSIYYYEPYSYLSFNTGSIRIDNASNKIVLYGSTTGNSVFKSGVEYKVIYNAGYTSTTIPQDLKICMTEISTHFYNQTAPAGISRLGIKSMNMGSATSEGQQFMDLVEMNNMWKITLDNYKLILI